MGIETSLKTVFDADATISGLVGSRIRPEVGYVGETGETIAYSVAETLVDHSEGVASLRKGSIVLECWGPTKARADALFDAVSAELDVSYPRTFGDVYLQMMRRVRSDSASSAITDTGENVPDWYLRTMEYSAVWH